MVKAVVGANWGDEGKGKITDMLADSSDIVIRFQGGANAGHTIINDYGRFALHILPSGIFHQNIVNIIGNGVALDINKFITELEDVVSKGVPQPKILISNRAQVLMPYHILQDTLEEERLAGKAFGSTKSGIAPFYSDKYAKTGIQVADLYYSDRLRDKINTILDKKNRLFNGLYNRFTEINAAVLTNELIKLGEKIQPYVTDTVEFIHKAVKENKTILLEGQLGSMKDPDFGIYPMTTSSHTLAGFGCIGASIPPTSISDIICVTKAYSSCVGSPTEPFVTELLGEAGDELRKRGGDKGEFGATTGRPRRVGWFDGVATRYGCMVQGATEVALTCLDVLGYLDEINICTHYEYNGTKFNTMPVPAILEQGVKPVYKTLPGWKCDIRGITDFNKLPTNAQNYVKEIESIIEVPIKLVSTGPKRSEICYR